MDAWPQAGVIIDGNVVTKERRESAVDIHSPDSKRELREAELAIGKQQEE